MIKKLVEFLRGRREEIVVSFQFEVREFDPSYGPQTVTKRIEVIDFDALLREMDEFSETFKEKGDGC